MNKTVLAPIFFVLLVFTLIYNISNSNEKIDNFFMLHKRIANIVATNKNFDIFVANNAKYKNFDFIQNDITQIRKDFEFIAQNKLFQELDNQSLKKLFEVLDNNMKVKINKIYKIISKTAVLNNSFRYMQQIQKSLDNQELIYIYTQIVGINYDIETNLEDLSNRIHLYSPKNSNEDLFISHSKIILEYYFSFKRLQQQIMSLKIGKKLLLFEKNFTTYSKTIITELKDVIWVLTLFIFLSMVIFLYNNHMLRKKQQELNRFKQAVENSDNIVLITDKEQKIKYVNEAFEKTTGYKLHEVLGKTPAILKSYQKSETFYSDLKNTIKAGKKWKGEFINKSKDGNITFEKASITPILNEDGEVEEYLAIKLDITKEKETDEILREKEKLLAQQSKMAAMREMLESIAHQWRQPLSTISTAASGITLNKEFDTLSKEQLSQYMNVIVDNTQYLSSTIDNFKNYFNTKNERTTFNVEETLHKVLDLIGYRLNESKTNVILNCDTIMIEGLENEFIQSFINMINNSLEAFSREAIEHKHIFIEAHKQNNGAMICIKDNAGGVNQEVIEHVFEPYFTTKHQVTGTGMGLFMVYEIITKHFKGEIAIENTQYVYENHHCKGTQILIHLPISHTHYEKTI